MFHSAYSIGGSPTHCSPSQRSYAVLSGLGVYKGSCKPKDIKKIANWKPNSQYLTPLRTRSGLKGINANQTPYPKIFKDVLGVK